MRRDARSAFFGSRTVHIGQNNFEGIGSNLNSRLLGAIRIQIVNLTNTRAVGLNQVQTVENISEVFVSRLRNTAADIVGRKTRQKSADRDKLDLFVIYVDNDAAAKAVITVYERIQQCLAQSFFGVVNLFDAFKTFKGRSCFVAEGKICESGIKLLKNRSAELLAITEFSVCFVRKNCYFCGMRALIWK